MDLNNNLLTEILKWIGLVFAAGFVGYFGRYIAMRIIERTNKKPDDTKALPGTKAEEPHEIKSNNEKENIKLSKKQAKSEQKRKKKEAAG